MDSGSTEILIENSCFRLYKDGHIDRVGGTDAVPAGFDADTGVTSKDVLINAVTGVAVRLYLPDIHVHAAESDGTDVSTGAVTKLPIVVFFHGGFFIVGSAGCPRYHRYVNSLAADARAIVVSVDYRLAPEYLLPAAYDDSWAALNWAVSGADPWLSEHGDLGRVFLAGASAGGNIAHNMAIAAGASGLFAAATRLEGAVLLHPSFSGEQRIEMESEEYRASVQMRWSVIFPGAMGGLDDPRMNPTAAGAPSLRTLPCERMLVCVASEDERLPRARAYYAAVKSSGWSGQVEWFQSESKGHAFFIGEHDCREAIELMERVVGFIAGH